MPSRSRNIIIGTTTIAFCASLTLHAFIAELAIEQYTSAKIHLPGFDRDGKIASSQSDRILVSLPPEQPPIASVPPERTPIVKKRGMTPPPEPEPEPEPKPDEQLGRSDGTGNAIDDSPGDEPLIARKGRQNQAWLSRDPSGPGQTRSDASASLLPPGNSGAPTVDAASPSAEVEAREAQPAAEAVIEQPELRSVPFGVGRIDETPNDVPFDRPATPQRAAVPEVVPVDARDANDSRDAQVAEQPGKPGTPNATDTAAADPAPQADTESDPFTVLGGAQFRSGSTKAQLGRAHRLIAPRIGLSGMVDGVQIGRLKIVLQLTIDATGNVTTATVFKSSGSDSIDHACRTTAYRWWFEPKKGNDGNPQRQETFLFLVTFS